MDWNSNEYLARGGEWVAEFSVNLHLVNLSYVQNQLDILGQTVFGKRHLVNVKFWKYVYVFQVYNTGHRHALVQLRRN